MSGEVEVARPLRFLIVEGYAQASRDELAAAGMGLAWELYARMLLRHRPGATYDVLLAADPGAALAEGTALGDYDGMLWTGSNLTIYHHDDPPVRAMVELGRAMYAAGVPAYGSCWGLQMAAAAAGGEVRVNPRGREMGIARKIRLTPEGLAHPFHGGKPPVFDGFISHYDEVVRLPAGAVRLAGNDFTGVQALAVTHGKGTFWAVQYHPEYDLREMARLFVARTGKLLKEGFYRTPDELTRDIARMEALAAEPGRKDLRWQLAIDDDLLDEKVRQVEFGNWLARLVEPAASRRG